jgi:sec-independent protein translocase protein TatA
VSAHALLRVSEYSYGGAMGEGLFSPLHLLLLVIIFLLLFGPSKFASVTKGLGKGLGDGYRNFKSAMNEGEQNKEEKEEKNVKTTDAKTSDEKKS